MAQAREKDGRVVFIGNIPYGVSEEQICELFGRCGSVVSFRLVYDKETGRPKGFGFLEYTNADSAAAATRNLNDYDIGGRKLRVAYSNDNDKGGKTAGDGGLALPNPGAGMGDVSSLPPLPPGVEIAPGVQAPDVISKTLTAIPPPQLLDILSQMKALVTSDPQKATALLQQAPQLSFALFQALLLLGLVDTSILSSLVATTQVAPAPPPQQIPPPQAIPPPFPAPGQMPPGFAPQQQFIPQGYPPQNFATPPPMPQYQAPPPVQQPGYGMPPGLTPEVVETVRQLTRDQIMGLDDNARGEIMKIRMSLGLQPMPQ